MNNKFIRLSLSAVAALMLTAFGPIASAQNIEYAPNRLLIEPKEGLSASNFDKILEKHNGRKRKLGQSNLHIVELSGRESEVAVLNKLRKDPSIKSVELDRKVKASFVPNDPYFGNMYHLSLLNAQAAWDTTKGEGVTIAILDSGIDTGHPDLAANLVPGWNTYNNNADVSDACGHGTAVAGSAAAILNNGQGLSGIAGGAKIMPVRIAFNDPVNGCYAYYSTIASGITWAADHGAKVVNVSYGGASGSSTVQNAANYLRSKGGLVFISAGNDYSESTIPANGSTIVVSATDEWDNKASWSTYGNFVSIAAPGENIWTTSMGGNYGQWRGTSFASPIVAGVAALVMSTNPKLTADEVQNILFTTAKDLGTPGKDTYFGYGRVDAAAAVAKAQSMIVAQPAPDTTAPIASITNLANGTTVSGLVSVEVNASDNVSVAQVQLKVNGTTVASDTSAPYSFSWDSSSVANGMVTLIAVATDSSGNTVTSEAISVNVSNYVAPPPAVDTAPPVVVCSNPVAGTVSGNVNVKGNASDNRPVSELTSRLYIDGVLYQQVSGGVISYQWNTKKASKGLHTIQITATDKAGNVGSTVVQVSTVQASAANK